MPQRSPRPLQIAVALCGCVPVAAGLAGVVLGPRMAGSALVGLQVLRRWTAISVICRACWLGIGLAFWSLIPDIARRGSAFRLLTALVVAGGLARLLGVALEGVPPPPMLFGLVMELIVTPLLCLWQARFGCV